MKPIKFVSFILFLALLPFKALAGAPSCTDVVHITSGDAYTASASDCIIRINVPFDHAAFEVNLPEDGDTFTIQNEAAYEGDQCDYDEVDQIYICYPRAIEVYSLDRIHHTVDSTGSVTDTGMYVQGESNYRSSDTFTWDDVSNWGANYDVWYPFLKRLSPEQGREKISRQHMRGIQFRE